MAGMQNGAFTRDPVQMLPQHLRQKATESMGRDLGGIQAGSEEK